MGIMRTEEYAPTAKIIAEKFENLFSQLSILDSDETKLNSLIDAINTEFTITFSCDFYGTYTDSEKYAVGVFKPDAAINRDDFWAVLLKGCYCTNASGESEHVGGDNFYIGDYANGTGMEAYTSTLPTFDTVDYSGESDIAQYFCNYCADYLEDNAVNVFVDADNNVDFIVLIVSADDVSITEGEDYTVNWGAEGARTYLLSLYGIYHFLTVEDV